MKTFTICFLRSHCIIGYIVTRFLSKQSPCSEHFALKDCSVCVFILQLSDFTEMDRPAQVIFQGAARKFFKFKLLSFAPSWM